MKPELNMLIVDDDRRMARTLADIVELSGYRARQAFSAEQALEAVRVDPPDFVLTDVRMPGMSGVELFREIHNLNPQLPVVLMTAYAPDDEIGVGLREGALGLLTKPLEITHLLDFLALLAKERVIAVVDDDVNFSRTLADILTRRGFQVSQVSDPQKVLEAVTPQAGTVLLDMKFSSMDGSQVVERIRARHPQLPILLITGYRREMAAAIEKALELSAFTCLYKPLDIPRLLETLDEVWKLRLKKALRGGQRAENGGAK
jgi:DNA-binding NtrC family response regulator